MCLITDDDPGKSSKDEKSETERVINDLVLACEAALLLRGFTLALTDPLALYAEKEKYRQRYKEIGEQIKAAIAKAKELK